MHDFSEPLSVGDVGYYVVVPSMLPCSAHVVQTTIAPARAAVQERWGIHMQDLAWGTLPDATHAYTYILYGPCDLLHLSSEEETYLKALGDRGYVNVISAYALENGADSRMYMEQAKEIPSLTRRLGIHAIYPDVLDQEAMIRTTDWEDVRDNIVCETIRAKYKPHKDDSREALAALAEAREKRSEDIRRLASLYERYQLWHRERTDGAVLVRALEPGQWLCSQTLTDKTKMTAGDFSLVTGFDATQGTVDYAGERIPSSDAPDLIGFLSLLGQEDTAPPPLLVHFHKNSITRGERFRDHVTRMKVEYGEFSSAHVVFDEFKRIGEDWLILREHGPVWVGDSVASFELFLQETLGLVPQL